MPASKFRRRKVSMAMRRVLVASKSSSFCMTAASLRSNKTAAASHCLSSFVIFVCCFPHSLQYHWSPRHAFPFLPPRRTYWGGGVGGSEMVVRQNLTAELNTSSPQWLLPSWGKSKVRRSAQFGRHPAPHETIRPPHPPFSYHHTGYTGMTAGFLQEGGRGVLRRSRNS